MKNAKFKKVYITNTQFALKDLGQFIDKALDNDHISFKDKGQFDQIMTKVNTNLVDYFRANSFELKYQGMDNQDSYHLFTITNGTEEIELIVTKELFRVYFTVE